MKLVLFSDLHAHKHAQYSRQLPNGLSSRLQDALDVMSQVRKVAVEREARAILFLGDLFHSRFNIDVDVLHSVYIELYKMASLVPTFVLRGNHDTFDATGNVNSILSFDGDQLTVWTQPAATTLRTRDEKEEVTIFAMPWHGDANVIRQSLQNPAVAGDVLLLHAAMKEGVVGPTDRKVDAELGLNDLPLDRFKWVFLGDYHKHQELVPGRVMYCGSPLQLTFGERDETKYILVLDTVTGEIEKIETEAPKFYKFESVGEFDAAVNADRVRPDVDFIRVEYAQPESAAIESLAKEFETVKFEWKPEETTPSVNTDRRILSDDSALVAEQLRTAEGDKPFLADYGLTILESVG